MAHVRAWPDTTRAEQADRFAGEQGIRLSSATICRLLRRWDLPLKKKPLIATERQPEQRADWWDAMAAVPIKQLVFLDETSTQIVMTRHRGRVPRGMRLRERVPRNHGENLTLLTAIGRDGITAPLVFPRALDGGCSASGCGTGWCRGCGPGRWW